MWMIGIVGLLCYVFAGIVIGMLIEHYDLFHDFIIDTFDMDFGNDDK